jgi:hypothetical protein
MLEIPVERDRTGSKHPTTLLSTVPCSMPYCMMGIRVQSWYCEDSVRVPQRSADTILHIAYQVVYTPSIMLESELNQAISYLYDQLPDVIEESNSHHHGLPCDSFVMHSSNGHHQNASTFESCRSCERWKEERIFCLHLPETEFDDCTS